MDPRPVAVSLRGNMRCLVSLQVLIVVAACAGETGAEPAPEPEPGAPAMDYDGPAIAAAFGVGSGAPLRVVAAAPTAGFALRVDGVQRAADAVELRVTLESPGSDEVVAQVLTEVACEVPQQELFGGGPVLPVRVAVAQVMRGAHYFVAPPHVLAARVAPPR